MTFAAFLINMVTLILIYYVFFLEFLVYVDFVIYFSTFKSMHLEFGHSLRFLYEGWDDDVFCTGWHNSMGRLIYAFLFLLKVFGNDYFHASL